MIYLPIIAMFAACVCGIAWLENVLQGKPAVESAGTSSYHLQSLALYSVDIDISTLNLIFHHHKGLILSNFQGNGISGKLEYNAETKEIDIKKF